MSVDLRINFCHKTFYSIVNVLFICASVFPKTLYLSLFRGKKIKSCPASKDWWQDAVRVPASAWFGETGFVGPGITIIQAADGCRSFFLVYQTTSLMGSHSLPSLYDPADLYDPACNCCWHTFALTPAVPGNWVWLWAGLDSPAQITCLDTWQSPRAL